MSEERNNYQITRKDARNCFVESLWDSFEIGKIHLAFATYDLNRPAGQRQTNNIHIYIAADEFLELCRKLNCGELRYMMQNKKKTTTRRRCTNAWAEHPLKSWRPMVAPDRTERACPAPRKLWSEIRQISCSLLTAVPARQPKKVLLYRSSAINRRTMWP